MSIDISEVVRAESARFDGALPSLFGRYAGRWVVFKDGAVVTDHGTEVDALTAAVERFGAQGGFVIGCVRDRSAVPLTAAIMFGHAAS